MIVNGSTIGIGGPPTPPMKRVSESLATVLLRWLDPWKSTSPPKTKAPLCTVKPSCAPPMTPFIGAEKACNGVPRADGLLRSRPKLPPMLRPAWMPVQLYIGINGGAL